MIQITNEDNMELMARYEDNHFDLAIVDPPYGIDHANKAGKMAGQQYGKAAAKKRNYESKDWDTEIPTLEYFNELKRVSKNQIIWGGNYFAHLLDPKSGWIFWDKDNGDNNFSDGELAWTSFDCGLRMKKITWNGMIQYDMKNKEDRFHPTQKPIRLYEWLLMNYAQKKCSHKHRESERYLCTDCKNSNVKILDTHLGSGSIALACHNLGFDLTACELDKDYYDAAMKRLKQHQSQLTMF